MRSKRMFITALFLVVFIATGTYATEPAPSGDTTTATGSAVNDSRDMSVNKKIINGGGIQELHPNHGGVGGYQGHQPAPYNYEEQESGDTRTTPFHQLMGNLVHEGTLAHRNGIVPEDLAGAKTWNVKLDMRVYDKVKVDPKFMVTDASAGRTDPKQRLYLLHYRPLSRKVEIKGRVQVRLTKDGLVPERPFEYGMEELWKATNAQFYFVEFNRNLIGSLDSFSFAGTGAASSLVNPTDFIANAIAAALFSFGKGSNDSKVWKEPIFSITAYSRYVSIEKTNRNVTNMQPLYREIWPDEPEKAETPAEVEESQTGSDQNGDESSTRVEILRCSSVKFPFDSSVIGPEQMDSIRCMNEKIANEPLGEFEHWGIIGSTCSIGSFGYNLPLGAERATEVKAKIEEKEQEVAKAVAAPLAAADAKRTGSIDATKNRIWVLSEGFLRQKYSAAKPPKRNEDSPEREAYLVKIYDDTLREE